MSQQLLSANRRSSGFTLIEVLVSMAVLTVGLVGMAAMVCSTMVFGTNAKYMNMANVLASEKLDNLNKWPSTDPNVAAGGSLTGPSTCAAGDTYCDQVTVSQMSGADYITQTQVVYDPTTTPPTQNNVTTTIVHTSSGCVDTPANCGVPNPNGAGSTFTRRWQITANPVIYDSSNNPATVTGGRRVTVLVSLVNNISSKQPVTFQMSMVRP